MIEINRLDGTTILTLEDIPEGSLVHRELGGDHYCKLPFILDEPVYLRIGDYVILPDFGRFELIDPYSPKYDKETAGYKYELQLDAYYIKWRNKVVRYMPTSAASETSFHLTATIDVHLGVIVNGINAIGAKDANFRYEGLEFKFQLFNFPADKVKAAKYKQYNNTNYISALNDLAQIFDCEWWVDGNIIFFGKCKLDGYEIDFELDVNVEEMGGSESKNDYATRIIAFGSDRNLPKDYRKNSSADITQNGVVQKRLMLPLKGEHACPNGYVQDANVYSETEAIEIVIVDEDVYPRTKCKVREVETYTNTYEDEETNETVTKTYYRIYDSSGLNFSTDYILEGETLHIIFQSGKMNGMDFECHYDDKKKYYEVVVNEDYGRELPDSNLHPEVGDEFVLYGWDSTKIGNTGLVEAAEEELYQHIIEKAQELKIDPNTYNCSMRSYWYLNKMETESFVVWSLGQPVRLLNPTYFQNGRSSRIIGYEIKLDIPYDMPEYIVGESAAYSRTKDMEQKIDSITFNGVTYESNGRGGSGVYLITTTSSTPASDYNSYSAKRADRQFLRKDIDDTAYGQITHKERSTFSKGITAYGSSTMVNASITNALAEYLKAAVADIAKAGIEEVTSDIIFDKLAEVMQKLLADNIESRSTAYEAGLSGYSIHKTANDRYRLEIDELLVRVKAIFNELEIRKLSYVGGNIEISPAGGTIYSTKPLTREDGTIYAYRCYMTADDGTTRTRNWWKVGDQAKCQTFNIDGEVVESDSLLGSDGELLSQGDSLIGYTRSGNASNRYYWRLVIGTGEAILEDGKTYNYVDLSDEKNVTLEVDGVTYTLEGMDSVFDGYDDDSGKWHDLFNDIPQKGDSIVMEGSQIDSERQHVIRITIVGENAPAIEEFVGVGARTQKEDGTEIGPWNLLARRKTCIAPRTGDEFVAKKFSLQTDDGKIYQVPADLGEWTEGMLVGYYARVSYQGSLWLCISKTGNKLLDGTIVEPSLSYPDIWVRQVAKGEKGDKGADGKQGEQGPQGEKGEDGAQGADGITISLEPSTIIIEQKSDSSGFVFPPASSITIMQGNTNITNRIASVNVGTCSGCRADVNKSTGDYKVLITALIGEPKTGYAQFNIVFTDINGKTTTRTATINFAVNYLGKFKSTIDADVETKIAEKTSYNYDGEVISIQDAITNVKTSSEGITQQVANIQGTLNEATGEITNIREDVSSIQQKADSIETSVTSLGKQVTETSNIAQTATSISMSVGNANRNLLSDSYINLVLKKGSYHVGQAYLTANNKYTLSAKGKVSVSGARMVVSIVGSDGNSNSITITESSSTAKSVTFVCPVSGLYDVTISGTYGTDANSRMICYYVQLEEGETATSYSRSKTDTISHINILPDMKYLSNGYMLDDELVEVDGVKCKSITKSTTGGGDVVRHNITLESNTLYTFSFMSKVISTTGDGKITAYLADLGGKKVSVCQGNIIEHTDRVGLAIDGYAPLETIKEGEWCRYIIHYMTDDLLDIQGTATLLVRCPDGMQASFCALKFEKGGMASNYGTAEQKLSNTGIDISEGKIRLTAETTTIDGDLQLNGIITENTTDNLYTDPKEATDGRKLFCIDMKETKSCVVPYGSFVVLPAIESVEPDTYWKNSIFAVTMPEYITAGSKLSITAAWSQDVSAWNLLQRDKDGFIDVAYVEDPNYRDLVILQEKATILCADPRILNSKDFNFSLKDDEASATTNFYPSESSNSIVLDGNMHGRFVLNGCLSRFLAILPGQTARLKSQILYVKEGSTAGSILVTDYSDRNATKVLLWDVENANDFYPIDATISCNLYNQDSKGYDWTSWKFYGISKTGGSSGVSQNSLGNGEFVFGPDVLNVRNWKNYPSNSSPVHFELEYGISRDINDNQKK